MKLESALLIVFCSVAVSLCGCSTATDAAAREQILAGQSLAGQGLAGQGLAGDEERNAGRDADRAHPHGAQIRFAQRLSEDGTMPDNALWRMKQQRDALLAAQPERAGLLTNWQWLGPGNIGGRIRAICVHPTNPRTMWCGSVGGGIFRTTNGGASWQPMEDFAPVMSVGCMILDPRNPDRIYAGTGEGFFDTLAGSSILAASRGAGIFVSDDGGVTWQQLPSTSGADFHFVNRLTISAADNKIMLAATMNGIFRTADAGVSWNRTLPAFSLDVDFHPTNGDLAVAGTRDGLPYYSTDGGITWTAASGTAWQERVEVTYAKGDPSIVYASCSLNNKIKVYRSSDGGRTFTQRTSGSGINTYSHYNNVIWVDPADSNHVLVGGVRLYKSTDGGTNFRNAYNGTYYDYHVIVEHPSYDGSSNRTVFHGNDGGFYRTTNVKASSISWQELNNNLGLTQFYGAAMAPDGTVVGGTQDNGTLVYKGNTEGWVREIGADGCYCAADPTDSQYLYGQIYWTRIYRSTNGGSSFSQIATRTKIPDKGSNFIPYITLDPNDPNRMYFAGASVWRSDNIKTSATFTEVKPALRCTTFAPTGQNAHFGLDPKCNVSIIAVAKGNSNIVWVGHNHGDVYMTTNALSSNRSWVRMDVPMVHPDRWVGSIAIDPRDNKRVYVSFLGYHTNNVWMTPDGGTTWQPINGTGTGALPATPANWITTHPTLPGCLFLGTDIGLFYSTDDGNSWKTTTEGGATSPIQELQWKNGRTLMVVTHGRGIFTVDVGEPGFVAGLGVGCGATQTPALSAGVPTIGKTQNFAVSNAAPNSRVLLIVDATPKNIPLGSGCTLRATGSVIAAIGSTNAAGSLIYGIAIPQSKNLLGATAAAQAAILVNGGPALGVADLTNGLEMRAGL